MCVAHVLQVAVAVPLDGTMAVEVEAAHCFLAWPFAADASLAAALTSVFAPPAPAPEDEPAGLGVGRGGAAPAAAKQPWQPQPWMYLNFLLTNSQLFLPVLDQACTL